MPYMVKFRTQVGTQVGTLRCVGFALGAIAGALIRRTVPAMAVTLAIFTVVQIAVPLWIRPHLFPADHTVVSVTSLDSFRPENLPGQPGAWLLSSETVNVAGYPVYAAPAAWPATASGRRSATSPPVATGSSREPRPRST